MIHLLRQYDDDYNENGQCEFAGGRQGFRFEDQGREFHRMR
jgi:hypothetical protein